MSGSQDEPLDLLHVDDDGRFCELVELFFQRDADLPDCRVTTETSPREALARVRADERSFDCVVTDYKMPGMNGIELLEAIRERRPELPVLLFSGQEPIDVSAEVIGAGLTDYLQKRNGGEAYTMLIRRVKHAVDSDGQFEPSAETKLEGVGIVGTDDRFETADEAYAACYGYDSTEVTGKHWTELHPEEEVDHIRQNVLPVVENGGKWNGLSKGLRSDGTTFTESKMVTALDDGRLLLSVSEADEE